MAIAEAMVGELDYEMAMTRKTLARVPADKHDWKPHEKSFSLGDLADHLAQIPRWGASVLQTEELDLEGVDAKEMMPQKADSAEQRLEIFDREVRGLRDNLAHTADADMMVPWTLRMGDKEIFSLPRVATMRSMIFNHMIHHRGQLTVYLRLLEVPLPAIYGPSADEES